MYLKKNKAREKLAIKALGQKINIESSFSRKVK